MDPYIEFLPLGWNQDASILPKPRGRRYSFPDMYIKDLDDGRAYRVEGLLFRGCDRKQPEGHKYDIIQFFFLFTRKEPPKFSLAMRYRSRKLLSSPNIPKGLFGSNGSIPLAHTYDLFFPFRKG